jgi:hypothetical protein
VPKGTRSRFPYKTIKVTHDYGEISDDDIFSMAITPDSQYLFVFCSDQLRQYRIDNHHLVHTYQYSHLIHSLITTVDSKYVYLALQDKTIQQICRDSQLTLRGLVRLDIISAMAVTRENDF